MNRMRIVLIIPAIFCSLLMPPMPAQECWETPWNSVPPGYVLRFERMGGYAGIYNQIWVYPDGHALDDGGKSAKVSSDEVKAWLEKLLEIAPSESAIPNIAQSVCMDCFIYRITVYARDKVRVFSFAAPILRKEVNPIVRSLSILMQQVR